LSNTRAREDQADALAEEMLDVARSALRAKSSEEAQGYRLLVDTPQVACEQNETPQTAFEACGQALISLGLAHARA
jgi:hypothetical protein